MKQTVLTTAIVVLALAGLARADGTIQLQNGALTRVWYCGGVTPFAGAFNFGVFVISSDGTQTLVLPLGTNTAQGLIAAPSPFPIPGTTEGQVVSLQVMGWSAEFGADWKAAFSGRFAVTPVRQFTLASRWSWHTNLAEYRNRPKPLLPPSILFARRSKILPLRSQGCRRGHQR